MWIWFQRCTKSIAWLDISCSIISASTLWSHTLPKPSWRHYYIGLQSSYDMSNRDSIIKLSQTLLKSHLQTWMVQDLQLIGGNLDFITIKTDFNKWKKKKSKLNISNEKSMRTKRIENLRQETFNLIGTISRPNMTSEKIILLLFFYLLL